MANQKDILSARPHDNACQERCTQRVHQMCPVSIVESNSRTDVVLTRDSADELTRFERLLLDISTGFINPPAGHFDDAITGALRRIVETLDIDRSTLNLMSTVRGRIEVAYSYAVPGLPPLPRMTSGPEVWPWAWSLLSANRPVVYASLDDLPAEAAFDRANWERTGLKSHVTMPMVVAGKLYGGLSFGTLRRERDWPEELLAQMRRVAEIFGSALVHKYTQEELDRALGFERLASQILASIFLEYPANEGDVIKQGLRDIGQFLRVDWVSLWERLPKRDSFRPIHGWRMEGVETTPDAVELDLAQRTACRGIHRQRRTPDRVALSNGRRGAWVGRIWGPFAPGGSHRERRAGQRSAGSWKRARGPDVAGGHDSGREAGCRGFCEPERATVRGAQKESRGDRGFAVARKTGAARARSYGRGDVGRACPRDHAAARRHRKLCVGRASAPRRRRAGPASRGRAARQSARPGDARR